MSGTVIEFLGLPGAGKTTLARSLADDLRSRGVDCREPTYHLAHATSQPKRYLTKGVATCVQSVTHPSFTASSIRAFGVSPTIPSWGTIRSFTNWQYVAGLVRAAATADAPYLLDQGACQALWSIAYMADPADTGAFESLLAELFSTPDRYVVVSVRASPEAIRRRLRERDGPGDHPFDAESLTEDVERGRDTLETVERVVTTASSAGEVETITVENSEDTELGEKVDEIVDGLSTEWIDG